MIKVLVAEDDKYLANAYRVKLTKAGFDIQMASDGEEVLSILETFTPDLILLDLIMPKRDGFSTLQELKSHEKWMQIPVIITTNLGQKEDIDKGMKLGAIDYVIKSDLKLEDLVNKIKTLLAAKT